MPVDTLIYEYISSEETYPDKRVIIEEGQYGDWVYVILEGKAKVKKKLERGSLTLCTLKEGNIFGEVTFLQIGEVPRTASIVADGQVTVGILDKERLARELLLVSPQLRRLLSTVVKRLQDSTDKASVSKP